mmetsp:Transcript_122569/g.291384  ORF Transcript_122569/g.291384 Transcript_122569/m.291384 type:complete len:203 (+) Transcript_122569:506-1114(+)
MVVVAIEDNPARWVGIFYACLLLGKVRLVVCGQFQALPRRRLVLLLAQHASAITHMSNGELVKLSIMIHNGTGCTAGVKLTLLHQDLLCLEENLCKDSCRVSLAVRVVQKRAAELPQRQVRAVMSSWPVTIVNSIHSEVILHHDYGETVLIWAFWLQALSAATADMCLCPIFHLLLVASWGNKHHPVLLSEALATLQVPVCN